MMKTAHTAGVSAESCHDNRVARVAGAQSLHLRQAGLTDLQSINLLIESAIATWDLPERVKRLSMPLYCYAAYDLDCLELVVAETTGIGIVGVAAWEQADPADAPRGHTALLLHGIYVATDQHRNGTGTRLLAAAEKAAASHGFDGVLVKAQPGAEHFFRARGLERLAVEDPRRDYPHRFWKLIRHG